MHHASAHSEAELRVRAIILPVQTTGLEKPPHGLEVLSAGHHVLADRVPASTPHIEVKDPLATPFDAHLENLVSANIRWATPAREWTPLSHVP